MNSILRHFTATVCVAAALPLSFAADETKSEKKDLRVLSEEKKENRVDRRTERLPKEPVTFLGVDTSPVSRTLSEQLGIPPDTGLVVNTVVPDSAAASVLKPHDILLKFDDQLLIERRQLSVLIRRRKEGDEVTLTYLRGGKEATAKVKLGKQEQPRVGGWHGEPEIRAFGLSPDGQGRILPLFDQSPGARTRVIRRGEGDRADVTIINPGNSNMIYSDDAGTLEIKVKEGKKEVIAKDAKGAVLFSGPFNTDQERAAAPNEVRARIEKLDRMEGFSFVIDDDFSAGQVDVLVPSGRKIELRKELELDPADKRVLKVRPQML